MYKSFLRPLLFKFDPEFVHNSLMTLASMFRSTPLQSIAESCFRFDDSSLNLRVFGLDFSNPVGLAAGFDKEGHAVELCEALGFSHLELGTVTPLPQPGNNRPRIFRLAADAALINRMGFPSSGCLELARQLQRLRSCPRRALLGVNIGKNKDTPLDSAISDYCDAFTALEPYADYFTLNVSSPNTPDLRKLQEKDRMEELFRSVQALNRRGCPLLVKIAPDLTWEQIDQVLECALQHGVAGIIATNTTLSRTELRSPCTEQGGLSGKPLYQRALQIVSHVYQSTKGKLPVVGVGGISCCDDVIAFMRAGASLVQVYTGLIYEGPGLVKKIKQQLAHYLNQQGLRNVSELTGNAVN